MLSILGPLLSGPLGELGKGLAWPPGHISSQTLFFELHFPCMLESYPPADKTHCQGYSLFCNLQSPYAASCLPTLIFSYLCQCSQPPAGGTQSYSTDASFLSPLLLLPGHC